MKRNGRVPNTIFVVWLISCVVFMIPRSLEAAPEITDLGLFTENFGPNSFGWAEGLIVHYGGTIQDSTYPIDHVTATYLPPPASSLTWSEYLTPDEDYWNSRLPGDFSGLGLGQSWGSVRITATNTQGESTTADTNALYHPLMIPLASNIQFSDTGITPNITWDSVTFDHDLNPSTPEVPVDWYHIRIYNGATLAEIFHTSGSQSFKNPTFQVPAGVLSPGKHYWVRILSVDGEQDGGQWFNMNRSSTYASFNTVDACACDLNADGHCDMRDWLFFGQRWGATNCATVPCACDLNADGRCNMQDWLLFGKSWGRTDCPKQ